jgi:hypothetical protein
VFLCFVLRLLSLFLILNIMIRIRVREKNEGKHSNLLLPKAASKPYTGVANVGAFQIAVWQRYFFKNNSSSRPFDSLTA